MLQGRPYEDIYDPMAMRVLTDWVQSCYAALGIIHSKWTAIPERFHDYIATAEVETYIARCIRPSPVPAGVGYEIQIRTEEMHRTSEYGIALLSAGARGSGHRVHHARQRGLQPQASPKVLALSRDPERRMEIEWAAEKDNRFFAKLYMRGTIAMPSSSSCFCSNSWAK